MRVVRRLVTGLRLASGSTVEGTTALVAAYLCDVSERSACQLVQAPWIRETLEFVSAAVLEVDRSPQHHVVHG